MKPSRASLFLPALCGVYTFGSFTYFFASLSGGASFLSVFGGCLYVLPTLAMFALFVGWLLGYRSRWWEVLLFLLWMVGVSGAQLVILADAAASV